MDTPEKREERLWHLARRRAAFKRSFLVYLIVNVFLIGVWYVTAGPNTYFWPIWPILGWGLGIGFQYAGAYHGNSVFSAEQEYEKLKKKENNIH
jgi:hypothetical protein